MKGHESRGCSSGYVGSRQGETTFLFIYITQNTYVAESA
jgi:hypothetical protein